MSRLRTLRYWWFSNKARSCARELRLNRQMRRTLEKIEATISTLDTVELTSRVGLLANYIPEYGLANELAEQPYTMFLAGISLKHKSPGESIPATEQVFEIISLLRQYLMQCFWNYMNISRANTETPDGAELEASLMSSKLIKQVNPCMYEFQMIDLLTSVFGRLDDFYSAAWGFTINDAIKFSSSVIDRYVRNVNECIAKMRCASIDTPSELFPERTKDAFIFSADSFYEEERVTDEERVRFVEYLQALSCSYGDYPPSYCSPLDDGELLTKPYIRLGDGAYFSPLPPHSNLLMGLPGQFEDLLIDERQKQSSVWQRYQRYRNDYAESRTREFLSRVFPKEAVFSNLRYGADGEIDILAIYDCKIILGEVKTRSFVHRLDRYRWDLKKNIEEAFSQAKRARDFIVANEDAQFRSDKKDEIVLRIEHGKRKRYEFLLLNVTFENLLSFGTGLKRLRELGLFTDDEYPWSVNLGELDILTRHVGSPTVFIHYFEKRLEAQDQNIFYSIDELTLFQWYLEHGGFFLPSLENGSTPDMVLIDASMEKAFDDYYIGNKECPKLHMDQEFRDIIRTLERMDTFGHSKVTSALLDVGASGREELVRNIKATVKKAMSDGRPHDFSALYKKDLDFGITVIVQIGRDGLAEKLGAYCQLKKYQTKTRRWLGLGIDIFDRQWPVNEFVFLDRAWERDQEIEGLLHEFPFPQPPQKRDGK